MTKARCFGSMKRVSCLERTCAGLMDIAKKRHARVILVGRLHSAFERRGLAMRSGFSKRKRELNSRV